HAHCLIAPTGRTRRDPDHRVTELRRGVAESPSADNANDRNRLAVYVRLPWRSWSVSQGPDCCAEPKDSAWVPSGGTGGGGQSNASAAPHAASDAFARV